jgi:hypothetical protein
MIKEKYGTEWEFWIVEDTQPSLQPAFEYPTRRMYFL